MKRGHRGTYSESIRYQFQKLIPDLRPYRQENSWFGRVETLFNNACTSGLAMRSGLNCAGVTSPSMRATESRYGKL